MDDEIKELIQQVKDCVEFPNDVDSLLEEIVKISYNNGYNMCAENVINVLK